MADKVENLMPQPKWFGGMVNTPPEDRARVRTMHPKFWQWDCDRYVRIGLECYRPKPRPNGKHWKKDSVMHLRRAALPMWPRPNIETDLLVLSRVGGGACNAKRHGG
jgi:hypothetical protein